MHLGGVGLYADVLQPGVFERHGEIAWAATHVEQCPAGRRLAMSRPPQVGDHGGGVLGERGVKPGRVGLFEVKLRQQPDRPGQRCPPGEEFGGGHHPTL